MVDISSLKNRKGKNMADLQKKLEESSGGGAKKDDRVWKPQMNKERNNGVAVVRFLPPNPEFVCDDWVEIISYSFRGPGGNYWENSLRTRGEDDPVAIANGLAWRKGEETGNESYKNESRKRKRKQEYSANVLVIKDPENPENEGKVKIFKFGPQIFKFIKDALKPPFEGEEHMNPFDMWDGANFKIKMVGKEIPDSRDPSKKVMVPNYESSAFEACSELAPDDDERKGELVGQTYDLNEFLKFKTFDELAARFKVVTGVPYNLYDPQVNSTDHVQELKEQANLDQSVDNNSGVNDFDGSGNKTSNDEKPPFNMGDDDEPEKVERKSEGGKLSKEELEKLKESDPLAYFDYMANQE